MPNKFQKKDTPVSKQDEKWLKQCPSRLEVANYVNSLMEFHYMPVITNHIQMSAMVLQAILIDKGVCTGEDIKEITEKFVSEQQRRAAIDAIEKGLVSKLNRAVTSINSGEWIVSENKQTFLKDALSKASSLLINLNLDGGKGVTDTDIQDVLKHLIDVRVEVDNDIISVKDTAAKGMLLDILTKSINRFQRGEPEDEKS